MRGVILYKIITIFALIMSLSAHDEYQLGNGVQVAEMPLYIGGYFSADYRNQADENRYRLDDIAILGYGDYNKFSYMAEFEYKGFYSQTYKNDTVTISKDTKIHTERLYVDYNFDDNYMLRIGKYNSPIGFWNLLPVNVLRDTTSSPMSTDILFPKFTTGVNASYASFNGSDFKIDLIAQNNEDLDDEYNNYKIDKHYGFGILYAKDDYSVKVNGGNFHKIESLNTPDNLYYFLISGKYDVEQYQILAEVGTQKSKSEYITNYAGYLQGLYRFSERHMGIVRFESYDEQFHDKRDDISILGYTYRPIYPVAIKSEYQFHSLTQENQFLFSLSVMF